MMPRPDKPRPSSRPSPLQWAEELGRAFSRVAVLALNGTSAEVVAVHGIGHSALGKSFSLLERTPLRWAVEAASPVVGAGRSPGGAAIAVTLGLEAPRAYAVVPLALPTGLVGLAYADAAGAAFSLAQVSAAFAFCQSLEAGGEALATPQSPSMPPAMARNVVSPLRRQRHPRPRTPRATRVAVPAPHAAEQDAETYTRSDEPLSPSLPQEEPAPSTEGGPVGFVTDTSSAVETTRQVSAAVAPTAKTAETAADDALERVEAAQFAAHVANFMAALAAATGATGEPIPDHSPAGALQAQAGEPPLLGEADFVQAEEASTPAPVPALSSLAAALANACPEAARGPPARAAVSGVTAPPEPNRSTSLQRSLRPEGPGPQRLPPPAPRPAASPVALPPPPHPTESPEAPPPPSLSSIGSSETLPAAPRPAPAAALPAGPPAAVPGAPLGTTVTINGTPMLYAEQVAVVTPTGVVPLERLPRRRTAWRVVSATAAGFVVASLSLLTLVAPASTPAAPRRSVTIPPQASLSTIAHELEAEGVVRSAVGFTWLARLWGADRAVRAGTYHLSPGAWAWDQLRALTGGQIDTLTVTVPEGLTLQEIANLLDARGLARADEVLQAASSPELLARYDLPGPTAEGFLFPDTYTFARGVSAREVVDVMVREFFVRSADLPEVAKASRDELFRRVILASIIEREARDKSELARIAGVFENRLARHMRLESCATVQYVLGHPKEKLSLADVRRPSPYNTYLRYGLPPGPIASPGLDALRAAFAPERHDLLFFFARDDGSHRHVFSRTYQEHLAAQQRLLAHRD